MSIHNFRHIVKIQKTHENAKLPQKSHRLDAGYDIFSIEDVIIPPYRTKLIRTGIRIEIETGYYGQIETRSSMACDGLFVTGGIIDAGYRNEVLVIVNNLKNIPHFIPKGYKIAQIIFHRVLDCSITETENLDIENDRGGGFGSSDTN